MSRDSEVREAIEALRGYPMSQALAGVPVSMWHFDPLGHYLEYDRVLAILDAHASEAAPVVGLSEAWAAAEAALPEGWEIAQATRVRVKGLESMQRWGAMAAPVVPKGRAWRAQHVTQFGDGPTPAEALLNLAARLTQTRTLGTDV